MPWITAAGPRCPIPGRPCPTGTIQARLAVRRQPVAFGIRGLVPAKIIPLDRGTHESCPGVSTSHDPGTDSWARRYGTGAQPAGAPDPPDCKPTARPVLLTSPAAVDPAGTSRGDARAPLTGPSTAAATAT